MPNSLKCRLKKLAYQGLLSEKDLSRIYTDNDVVAELENIKSEIEKLNNTDYGSMFSYEAHKGAGDMQYDIINIIERRISELKGE